MYSIWKMLPTFTIIYCLVAAIFAIAVAAESTTTMPLPASNETSNPGATKALIAMTVSPEAVRSSSSVDTTTIASTEPVWDTEEPKSNLVQKTGTTQNHSTTLIPPESTTVGPTVTADHITTETSTTPAHNLSVVPLPPDNNLSTTTSRSDPVTMTTGMTTTHTSSVINTPLEKATTMPTAISDTVTKTTSTTEYQNPPAAPTPQENNVAMLTTTSNPTTLTSITSIASLTSIENNTNTMETDTTQTHNPIASPTSEQYIMASYSTSVYATIDMSSISAHTGLDLPMSPEKDLTTPAVTLVSVTSETAPTQNPIPLPTSLKKDSTTPFSTSSPFTTETFTIPHHNPLPTATSPENSSTTPPSSLTTFETITSSDNNPLPSPTFSENDSSTPPSNPTTFETSTTPDHNPLPFPTFPEVHSTTAAATSELFTMETAMSSSQNHTSVSMFIESIPTIPTDIPGNVTQRAMTTQNYTISPTSPGNTLTMVTITQDYVTMTTGTTPSQSHTATHPALESTPSTPSGTTDNTTPKVSTTQTVMTATPQKEMTTDNVTVMSHPSTVTATSSSQPVTSTSVPDISTILAPTAISATVAGTSHSSPALEVSTTTNSPPNSQTTQTPGPNPSSTTHPPGPGNDTTSTLNTTKTPARPARFCFPVNPCPFDSRCEELFMTFRCLCLPGSFLSEGSCVRAKVFPLRLHLTSLRFQVEMTDRSSQIFLETAANISESLREALRDQPGYISSTVLELRQGSVVATMNNVFLMSSNASQESTSAAIMEAIQACDRSNCGFLAGAWFKETNLCSQNPSPCDTMTTDCISSGDGIVTCNCRSGYISSRFSNRGCTACPSGEKEENGNCVACPFGYAGFNCNDSSLLAVVVISCVLGGLLLILLLAFVMYCCRGMQEEPNYSSPYPAEDFRGMWSNKEVLPIPRASLNWDSAQIEMTESGNHAPMAKSHSNGVAGSYNVSRGDLKTFKGKHTSRYSYLVQGHENPYFLGEDEKRAT